MVEGFLPVVAVVVAATAVFSGESASMSILLSGLGLAGEYACDMLRARGFAIGNGFGVGGGGGGGSWFCVSDSVGGASGTILSDATRVSLAATAVTVEDEAVGCCVEGGGNGGVVDGKRSGTDCVMREMGRGG